MKPPILIYEPVDLSVFRSVKSAESYLEAIDVKNEIYVGFDSEGRKLRLQVNAADGVVITDSDQQPRPSELKKILIEFLSNPAIPEPHRAPAEFLETCSLPDLVTRALHFEIR